VEHTIEELKANYEKAKKLYFDVIKQCPHEIIQEGSLARCSICGMYFNWYCQESPDHVCHYYSRNELIELVDGSAIPVSKNHDPDNETDDECMFCHLPEERK